MKKIVLLLVILLGFGYFSCKKDSKTTDTANVDSTPQPVGDGETCLSTFNLDGNATTIDGSTATYQCFVGYSGNGPETNWNSSIYDESKKSAICGVGIVYGRIKYPYYSVSETEFHNTFYIGNYPFGNDTILGVEVGIYGQDLKQWSTRYGVQTGSSFKITNIKNCVIMFCRYYLTVFNSFDKVLLYS